MIKARGGVAALLIALAAGGSAAFERLPWVKTDPAVSDAVARAFCVYVYRRPELMDREERAACARLGVVLA